MTVSQDNYLQLPLHCINIKNKCYYILSIAKGMIRKYYRISALKCENNTEIDSAQA